MISDLFSFFKFIIKSNNERGALSFKLYLILILMAIGLIPLASTISLNLPKVLTIIQTAYENECVTDLQKVFFELRLTVSKRYESGRLLAGIPGVRDYVKGDFPHGLSNKTIQTRLLKLTKKWFKDQGDILKIALYDLSGKEILSFLNMDGQLLEVNEEYLNTVNDKVIEEIKKDVNPSYSGATIMIFETISDKKIGFSSNKPGITLLYPVYDYSGILAGFSAVTVNLLETIKKFECDYIFTGAGEIIYQSNPELLHEFDSIFYLFPELKEELPHNKPFVINDEDIGRIAWVPVFAGRYNGNSLWAGRILDMSFVEKVRHSILKRISLVVTIIIVIVFVGGLYFASVVDRHRKELVDALHQLLLKNRKIRLNWSGPAEIKTLSRELDRLFDRYIENDAIRRDALEKIEKLNKLMRITLDNAAEGIMQLNEKREIVFVNPSVCRILGFSVDELEGSDLHSILHFLREDRSQDIKDDCPFCMAVKSEVEEGIVEGKFMRQDGTSVQVEYLTALIKDNFGRMTGMVMCIRDVTLKKSAEQQAAQLREQLFHAQKMESIGTLAGGVAHDFNNLLTVVIGYCELLEYDVQNNATLLQQVKSIHKAAARAASLTRQLLAFSRKQVAQKSLTDLNQLVIDQEKLLNRLIGDEITMQTNIDEEKTEVYADPGMIGQVIMNLVVNAKDAMEGKPGKIVISLKRVSIESDNVKMYSGGRPGNFILLSVSDTGIGIDPACQKRIFDPFFTTKELGRGTGLGLSVVYGIVEQHGGWINCLSEPGKGAIFNIFLPETRVDLGQKKELVKDSMENENSDKIGKGLTAFVLEDDVMVLELTVDFLKTMGFQVVYATNIKEALDVMNKISDSISFVMSDVMLPDGSGVDFIEQVMDRWPAIPLLLTSGYMEEDENRERITDLKIPFVPKPYGFQELFAIISRILKGH